VLPALRLLAALACVLAPVPAAARPPPATQAGTQAPPPGFDTTPSDPAATGFLTAVVDGRVYSHEAAGAVRLTARVRAQFVVTAALQKEQPSTQLEFDLSYEYATGTFSLTPVDSSKTAHHALLMAIQQDARAALLLRPSRSAQGWKVSFHQDGADYRLDYLPRQTGGGMIESFSEWFAPDGTPRRRKVVSRVPNGNKDFNSVTQDVALVYEPAGKRVVLKELKPIEQITGQFSIRMEYAERDGLQLLTRHVKEEAGWRLTLDFDSKVELAAKR